MEGSRQCSSCSLMLPASSFSLKSKSCRSCKSEYDKKYKLVYQNRRAALRLLNEKSKDELCLRVLNYLSDKCCSQCGHKDIRVLEFHRDGNTDSKNTVSRLLYNKMRWDLALDEIQKSEILCANCRCIKTAKNSGHRKSKLCKTIK